MRVRRCLTVWAVALLLTAVGVNAGATVPPEGEVFRCELNEFVRELGTLPEFGGEALREAEARLAELDGEQLEALRAGFAQFPNWERIPVVLASLHGADLDYARQQLARSVAAGAPGLAPTGEQELEWFRDDFLFMLDQMGKFGPLMEPDYAERVAAIRAKVEQMPLDAIPFLQKEYIEQAPALRAMILGGAADPDFGGIGANSLLDDPADVAVHGCDCSCGISIGCWKDCVSCIFSEIGRLGRQVTDLLNQIGNFVSTFFNTTLPNLFSKVAALPGQILSFFTGLWDRIKALLEAAWNGLLSIVPRSVSDVLDLLGIDPNNINFDWTTIASSIPTLAPPCDGPVLGDIVEVAADICDRGGDALTELLFEVIPEDGLSVAIKISIGLIHFPLTYLCQCADSEDAIAFADAQAEHRDLTAQRLDLQLSTRATQSSVNALSLALGDLDRDVEQVESKLDTIEATAGRIETNVDRANQTASRIRSNVETIETTNSRSITNLTTIEDTTDRTSGKLDLLIAGNDDQQKWLEQFETLVTRLQIENNLLENRPDAISLFQLPAAFGGMLETVALIAADTIQLHLIAGQPVFGAERELERGDALRAAGDFVRAFEAYRSAYREAVK